MRLSDTAGERMTRAMTQEAIARKSRAPAPAPAQAPMPTPTPTPKRTPQMVSDLRDQIRRILEAAGELVAMVDASVGPPLTCPAVMTKGEVCGRASVQDGLCRTHSVAYRARLEATRANRSWREGYQRLNARGAVLVEMLRDAGVEVLMNPAVSEGLSPRFELVDAEALLTLLGAKTDPGLVD